MKYKTALISILFLLLLSAFAQNPKPAGASLSRPLLALPLPEGRTYDQAHDSGFIDWSGSVGYVHLHHKDNTALPPEEGGTFCGNPGGCWEWVTRISNGGAISGSFAPVGVVYFEVMVAHTHDSAAGTAILNACGSSLAWPLYIGPGSGLPGFVSMSIPVPSGCTSWSLSASGGYVDFRSVDANYVSPPPPVATNTFTPVPTETFTPSPIATETSTPTVTETPTATESPTGTMTLVPGVTPSDTPTPTDTPLPTLTSTPSATLPPGVTPSDTPVPSNTPIPPAPTNTPAQPPSSGGEQGGSGGFVLPTGSFTSTALPQPASTSRPPNLTPNTLTPNLVETARVMIFGASTPTPTPKPGGSSQSRPDDRVGKTGSGFPWWLLLAGGAIGGALVRRAFEKRAAMSIVQTRSGAPGTATCPLPNVSSPAPITRLPHYETRTVQDGWKTITERVPRFITQTVQNGWKTITERVPRFITQTVQEGWKTITERVPRFVTQTIQQGYKTIVQPVTEWVSRTIWEPVKKWIPGLGWLAEKVKKTVVEPVTHFVTKTVPNFVTKTMQAGWDFVTKTVPNFVTKTVQAGWDFVTKTVPNFVTKTVQAGWNFVTKTVPNFVARTVRVGWEMVQQGMETVQKALGQVKEQVTGAFRKHPVIAWGTAGALTAGAAVGARNLYCYGSLLPPVSALDLASLFALPVAGLLTTDRKRRLYGLFVGLLVSGMILSACAPKPGSPTPAISICPEPPTQTPAPTRTPNPPTGTPLPAWMSATTIETNVQLHLLQEWLAKNGLPSSWDDVKKWQNQFDPFILQIAQERNIPPKLLKALFLHEGQFVPIPNNPNRPDALGMGQVLPSGIDTAFNFSNSSNVQEWRRKTYELIVQAGDAGKMVNISGQPISPDKYGGDYQLFYQQLHPDAQMLFRSYFIGFINNKCDHRERLANNCQNEGEVNWVEVPKNLEFAADVLMAGDKALSRYLERVKGQDTQFWQDFWNKLPEEEKWKVRVATYNSGQGCVGEAIFATGGQATSWEQIAKQLGTDCIQADDEVNDVWDYLP